MRWGSLSFPAAAIIMTILVLASLFVLLLRGVRHRPWRLLCYQQECTNRNTFAWVIDLYLPTFLTAFPSYWQYKHMGRHITFHSHSTFSLFVSLAHLFILFLRLCLSASAICLNKTGQTMVLLISAIFLSLQISENNIIRLIQWLLFSLRYRDISSIQYSFDTLALGERVVCLFVCSQCWFHHKS